MHVCIYSNIHDPSNERLGFNHHVENNQEQLIYFIVLPSKKNKMHSYTTYTPSLGTTSSDLSFLNNFLV